MSYPCCSRLQASIKHGRASIHPSEACDCALLAHELGKLPDTPVHVGAEVAQCPEAVSGHHDFLCVGLVLSALEVMPISAAVAFISG